MTQVLSTLNKNAADKISRLAIASSTAALVYWGYLVLVRHNKRDNKQAQRQRRSSGKPGDQQQQQATTKTKQKGGDNEDDDGVHQVVFVDRAAERKKQKRRPDMSVTLRHLTIILRSVMTYREVALCCGVTLGLILRTLLDLWNIQISTRVESAIITANTQQLKHTLISFAITTPTLAFVNNIIKFFADKLSLRIRYNLSRILYNKYMTGLTFYHLSQQSDFQNVDQLLTADVDKFASSIVEVYSNVSKPILDIVLLVHRMSSTYTGGNTPAIMIGWLAFVGSILTQARRPLAGYIIRETQCEGQLRFVHSRLIQNNEEIAFFKGNNKEKHTLMSALDTLQEALEDLILFKFKIGFMDNIVGRYSSTVVGYLALAMPFFSSRYAESSSEERLNQYYVSGRMMMKLAESITRVILAGQDLSKLSAYTQRVKSLMDSMDSLSNHSSGQNSSCVAESTKSKESATTNTDTITNGTSGGAIVEICDKNNPMIDFKNVTLSTPNGDILVKNLTFTIKPKQSVIIAGPNGSGKSSLFRVLGNLWKVESGKLVRPPTEQLFYICQKPYMTLGTLRNQIIFPDTRSKLNDQQLVDILNIVELKYLLDRGEHSLDSIQDWQDVLSGGEKQRMALARLIYHKPLFAILDECTSAVAIDVEQRIYKYLCESLGCTLLSVTHRVKQLAKFHHLILEFDGCGSFEFKRLTAPI